jgi:hypothetical protein
MANSDEQRVMNGFSEGQSHCIAEIFRSIGRICSWLTPLLQTSLSFFGRRPVRGRNFSCLTEKIAISQNLALYAHGFDHPPEVGG